MKRKLADIAIMAVFGLAGTLVTGELFYASYQELQISKISEPLAFAGAVVATVTFYLLNILWIQLTDEEVPCPSGPPDF